MGPSINKRNAALIQSFMADILSVPSDRGIVKFTPIEEVNYAMNGTTMHGEIERLEKHQAENGGVGNAVRRAVTNASRRSLTSSTSNGVPPKLDTDVKTPSSGITPNGISASDHDDDAKRQKRKSMTTTPPPSSAIPNVFELAATESNDRPSTAHGTPYAAENGLRMNGISKEDLVGSGARAPNGRPKTFAGSSASPDHSAHDPMPSSQQSQPQRPSTSHQRNSSYRKSVAGDTASSSTVSARRSGNIPISPKPDRTSKSAAAEPPSIRDRTSKAPTEPGTKSPGPSSAASPLPKRDTYLDNISSTSTPTDPPTTSAASSSKPKRDTPHPTDPKLDAKASERSRHHSQQESKDTAANTAKRRSTVTATPKIPPPPPVPQDSRKSGSGGAGGGGKDQQQRVGKRKSFLSAFRRSAAA
ncbi:hypothetical protein KC343_g20201 [Hortaea werneckii]|nr:hypothetical protein KC343_g20201 [Hortaea werneckii]